jgi:hypothetical protein
MTKGTTTVPPTHEETKSSCRLRHIAMIAFFITIVVSSPRVIAGPVFVTATIISLWLGLSGYRKTKIAAWILLAVVSLSPIDL